jgi:Transposase, Mutator family
VLVLCRQHPRIRTTNGFERLNEEIKRRTRGVRIVPNPEARLRLVTALCVEQLEEWVSGRRYLDMSVPLPAVQEERRAGEGVSRTLCGGRWLYHGDRLEAPPQPPHRRTTGIGTKWGGYQSDGWRYTAKGYSIIATIVKAAILTHHGHPTGEQASERHRPGGLAGR